MSESLPAETMCAEAADMLRRWRSWAEHQNLPMHEFVKLLDDSDALNDRLEEFVIERSREMTP